VKIGTKSVLFGAHQFLIHPWFVAWAWWKLYGFPIDPRLWVSFFVHDLGYWGKPNMDGPEGERHVEFGAWVMHLLFDKWWRGPFGGESAWRWHNFTMYNSRFYAKRDGQPHSRLCVADKLAIALTPAWLYLPLARMTGEIHEYMGLAKDAGAASKYASMNIWSPQQRQWYLNVQEYLRRWVNEHKDGREDSWTPNQRQARDAHGVWQ
jgi:hypothetical protein